jgi:hypothetical protein
VKPGLAIEAVEIGTDELAVLHTKAGVVDEIWQKAPDCISSRPLCPAIRRGNLLIRRIEPHNVPAFDHPLHTFLARIAFQLPDDYRTEREKRHESNYKVVFGAVVRAPNSYNPSLGTKCRKHDASDLPRQDFVIVVY